MAATFSTLKPRGKLFEKGMKKTGGRKAGAQNVATLAVKQMIACAAAGLGGTARLIEWAKESERNEYAFWVHIWPRLLPLQVQGTGARGELELNLKLNREEFTKRLLERGLPTVLFGIDAPEPEPVLELPATTEAPRINGNGQDHPGNGHDPDEP
jgi:hypothetical protein